MGTLMFNLTSDMSMTVLFEINRAVSNTTRVEGGRGMALTHDGVLMYYDISEDEADEINERIERMVGEDMLDRLNPVFDEIDDEEASA